MSQEYIETMTLEGGLKKKLVKLVSEAVAPLAYYGFKDAASSEIIYVSFGTVPQTAGDAFVISNISESHNIMGDETIQKLIRTGETSNFTRISDTSFSIDVTGVGTVTYNRITTTPFLFQSEAPVEEANKAVTVNQWNYETPVEVTPSSGNDVMDKVTLTLTGIIDKLYCWKNISNQNQLLYTLSPTSDCKFALQSGAQRGAVGIRSVVPKEGTDDFVLCGYGTQYTRNPAGDIIVRTSIEVTPEWWNSIPPNGLTFLVQDASSSLSWYFSSDGTSTLADLNSTAATAKGATAGTLVLKFNDPTTYCCENVTN